MEPDEQAIRAVHLAWMEAVNSGEVNRLLGLMADDCLFLNPGQAAFGREGFAPNFLEAHQRNFIKCVSDLEEVVAVGELAFARSRDSLSVTLRAGGETVQFAGDRLTIYRKQANGKWLLARDAHTLSPVEK